MHKKPTLPEMALAVLGDRLLREGVPPVDVPLKIREEFKENAKGGK